jgi:hypothetical protein
MSKKYLTLSVLAAAMALFTVHPGVGYSAGAPSENFAQRKAETLRRIDQRIAHLNDQKSCVQAANSSDTLKNCRARSKEGNQQRNRP